MTTAPQTKTFKTPTKGTELPLLIMKRKIFDKDLNVWVTKENPYLQVAHRLVWFREDHADWTIETEWLTLENQENRAIYRARIKDATGRLIAEATKQETKADFPDYIEKAETGAIGRALALCGYGTQFAPEFDEGDRLADAPIAPAKPAAAPGRKPGVPPPTKADRDFDASLERTPPSPVRQRMVEGMKRPAAPTS